jgi:hypothetical protein
MVNIAPATWLAGGEEAMLKIAISGIVLGAAFGAAGYADPERMTGSTPVPVILAQVTPGNSSTSAFDAGLADRRAYEEWFASLTGDFQKGAEYWAGQRSLTKPGSCFLADGSSAGEWTQGCLAAQRQLAPSDVRRKAEPDYRQGWNAYSAAPTTPAATATPPAAEPSPASAEGLADRQAWEHYFNELSGQTKEGAEWWTAHRSEKGASCQPTTTEQQGQWQTGCLSAKRQLDPTDERRLAEPDYRLGWNSYTEPTSQPTTAPGASASGSTAAMGAYAASPNERADQVSPVPNAPASPAPQDTARTPGWNARTPGEVATPAPVATPPQNVPPIAPNTPSPSPSAAAPATTASQSSLAALQQALDKAFEVKRAADAADAQLQARHNELFWIGQNARTITPELRRNADEMEEVQRAMGQSAMRMVLANDEVERAKKALADVQDAERQIAEQAERARVQAETAKAEAAARIAAAQQAAQQAAESARVQAETEKAEAAARIASAQKAAQQQQAQAAERDERARVVAEAEVESAEKRTEALKAETAATNEAAAKIEAARKTQAAAQAEADKATQREKAAKEQVEADKAAAVAREKEIKERPDTAPASQPTVSGPVASTPGPTAATGADTASPTEGAHKASPLPGMPASPAPQVATRPPVTVKPAHIPFAPIKATGKECEWRFMEETSKVFELPANQVAIVCSMEGFSARMTPTDIFNAIGGVNYSQQTDPHARAQVEQWIGHAWDKSTDKVKDLFTILDHLAND